MLLKISKIACAKFKVATDLTKFGFILTILWCAFVTLYVLYAWATGHDALSLNELGDFLAGSVAPLALIWLVLGYYQQGQELRMQREELANQREELALQRRELKRQADLKQRELSDEEDARQAAYRPDLRLSPQTEDAEKRQIIIGCENKGHTVRYLSVVALEQEEYILNAVIGFHDRLDQDHSCTINIHMQNEINDWPKTIIFFIKYTDALDKSWYECVEYLRLPIKVVKEIGRISGPLSNADLIGYMENIQNRP
jgi:hypothetical protein